MPNNAINLEAELNWLRDVIRKRLGATSLHNSISSHNTLPPNELLEEVTSPELLTCNSRYGSFVIDNALSDQARLLLILALANHILPDRLSSLFKHFERAGHLRPEFGAVSGINFSGFIPSGLTYMYLVAGYDLEARLEAQQIFTEGHVLARENVLTLESHYQGEPSLSGRLIVHEHWVEHFTLEHSTVDQHSIKYNAVTARNMPITPTNPTV
jgi:hypothetical protein